MCCGCAQVPFNRYLEVCVFFKEILIFLQPIILIVYWVFLSAAQEVSIYAVLVHGVINSEVWVSEVFLVRHRFNWPHRAVLFGVPYSLLYVYAMNMPVSLYRGKDVYKPIMPWNENPAFAVAFSSAIVLAWLGMYRLAFGAWERKERWYHRRPDGWEFKLQYFAYGRGSTGSSNNGMVYNSAKSTTSRGSPPSGVASNTSRRSPPPQITLSES